MGHDYVHTVQTDLSAKESYEESLIYPMNSDIETTAIMNIIYLTDEIGSNNQLSGLP